MGVMVDPIVCALAIKAATTKRPVVALCELGDGDNAFALMRVLLENARLLEWLIRGEGHRRLETYVIFTSVVHQRIVALAERFRDRFIAAGVDSLPKSDSYHQAVAEHVFGNTKDDRPTLELISYKGTLKRVSVKDMFDAIKDTQHSFSFEYQMMYGSLGSDIIHSGPFSLTRTLTTLLDRSMFVLRPTPLPDLCTLALAMSNAAMFLVLDSLNEYVGLGLLADLAALKAGSQNDLRTAAPGDTATDEIGV